MKRLLVAGGGAIGTAAAVLAARAAPASEVVIVDAGSRFAADRTFVLGASTVSCLRAAGTWQRLEEASLPLQEAEVSFAGAFGKLHLAAADVDADAYAYSVAESAFLDSWQELAQEQPNLETVADTKIAGISVDDDSVSFACDGAARNLTGDFAAIAGVPPKLLEPAGFRFASKGYHHAASVASIVDDRHGHAAQERSLAGGASTLVPRRGGWGHIQLAAPAQCDKLEHLSDSELLRHISSVHGRSFSDEARISFRGRFLPQLRQARPAGRGRIALLGAAACAVHPIGAQELNLGLRDAIRLSQLLEGVGDTELTLLGDRHAAARQHDRSNVARRTDLAACLAESSFPGKQALGGAAAAVADLCPAARRALLAAWVIAEA